MTGHGLLAHAVLGLGLLQPTAGGPGAGGAPPTGAEPTRTAGDGADVAALAAQAEAASRAAQDIEAQLAELRASLAVSAAQRAALEDLKRQIEELEARSRERERARAAAEGREVALFPALAARRALDLTLTSPDGAFAIEPGVLVQVQYEGALVEEGPGEKILRDRSGFAVRRAKLRIGGHAVDPSLRYRLQIEFAGAPVGASTDRRPYLEDAYLEWAARGWLSLRAGQAKVPYGFQRLVSARALEVLDRSAAMLAFDQDRDAGLWALLAPWAGRLKVQVGLSNGAGRNRANDNVDVAGDGRIVVEPLGAMADSEGDLVRSPRPLVSLGGAVRYQVVPTDAVVRAGDGDESRADVDGDGRVDGVAVALVSGELRARYRGLSLQGELFWRREDPGAAAPDRTYHGGYLQLGAVAASGLGVVARHGRNQHPLWGATPAARAERGATTVEWLAGVNLFLAGHDLKLQADYAWLVDRDARVGAATFDRGSHRLRVATSLSF